MPGPRRISPRPDSRHHSSRRTCPSPTSASAAAPHTAGALARIAGTARLPRSARPPHPPRPGRHPHRAASATSSFLCSQHYCRTCRKYFQRRLLRPGPPRQPLHPARVVRHRHPAGASRNGLHYPRRREWALSARAIACSSPSPRSRNWVEAGEKTARRIDGKSISTGPSPTSRAISPSTSARRTALLRVVDRRQSHLQAAHLPGPRSRPDARRITAFFRRFHAALTARGLTVKGITTDGSGAVSRADRRGLRRRPPSGLHLPASSAAGDQGGPLGRGIAESRKRLAATSPKLPRGPPWHQGGRTCGPACRRRSSGVVGELFEHRHLFVRQGARAPPSGRRCGGSPAAGRSLLLCELMEEVYRLFDRRCLMATRAGQAGGAAPGCGGPVGCGRS